MTIKKFHLNSVLKTSSEKTHPKKLKITHTIAHFLKSQRYM